MPERDAALVLFTLSPRAEGKRKSVDPAVVAALIARVRSLASSLEDVDLVIAAPSDFPRKGFRERRLTQRGRDFGESLRLAVEDAFALGYRRVVVVGNDAPEITSAYLRRAFDALASDESTAVVGPAADGGYNLLGLGAPCAEAFQSIPWGSAAVCELTLDRLARRGRKVLLLEAVPDVDDPRALHRLVRRLGRRAEAELRKLGRRLRELVSPPLPPIEISAAAPTLRLASVRLLRGPPR